MTRDRRDARGNVTVLVAAVIVVAVLLATAVARFGGAVAEKSRANNAADAAALAAADGLALGRSPDEACALARSTAVDNGARLLTCVYRASTTEARSAEVVVEIGNAKARARAEVGSAGP